MIRGPLGARAALIGVALLFAVPSARADIIGLQWRQVGPTEVWLYAEVDPFTFLLNADLGDTNIAAAPDGVNTGLYTTKGVALVTSSLTIEARGGDLFEPRPLSISPSGSGSLLDGAWFTTAGAVPDLVDLGGGLIRAVLLARIDLEHPTTRIGGPNGGPAGTTQSRVYLGWVDEQMRGGAGEFGVFDIPQIPAPAPILAAGPMILTASRRRRAPQL